jgi:hypothetical protein
MSPYRIIVCFFAAALVSDCAGSLLANTKQARLSYENSVADYRACLAANQTNVSACDAKRLSMETEERHWKNLSDELKYPGETITTRNTVTIQQR